MSLKDHLINIVKEISARRKYVHGDKGILEDKYKQLKQWQPEGKGRKFARIAGLGGIDLSWFLFCLFKYTVKDLNTVLLDNKIIDALKAKNENLKIENSDSNFKKFYKKLKKSYPKTAARMRLWMIYGLFTSLVVGGVKLSEHDAEHDNNKNIYENSIEKDVDFEKTNYETFLNKMNPITPWLIAQLISVEGVVLDENGLHKPYLDGKGVWTIGFGSTRLKDGKPVTEDTPHMTNEEAYDLARWHLEERETYFYLYCYSVANKNLAPRNTGEAFALASILYNSGTKFIEFEEDSNHKNRFETLRQEYKKYGNEISDSTVLEAFKKYPIVNKCALGKAWIDSNDLQVMADAIGLYMKDGRGMHWRRWLEAGLFIGAISPEDLLECPIGGFYDFYLYMGGWQEDDKVAKSSLWEISENGITLKKSTYAIFKQWLKNPKTRSRETGEESDITQQKVKDFLPEYILDQCMSGKCEIGDFKRNDNIIVAEFNKGIKNIKSKSGINNINIENDRYLS